MKRAMPDSGVRRPRRILAIIRGTEDDTAIIARARSIAQEHAARLTVMHLWSPKPLLTWAPLAGVAHGRRRELIGFQQEEAARRLRLIGANLPQDLPCTLVCRRSRGARTLVAEVLVHGHDCVVAGKQGISARGRRRLRRIDPELNIVLV